MRFFLFFLIFYINTASATPFSDAIANSTNGSVQNTGPYSVDIHKNKFLVGELDIPGYNNHIVVNGKDYIKNINDAIIVSDFWIELSSLKVDFIPDWVWEFIVSDLKKTYNPQENLIELRREAMVKYVFGIEIRYLSMPLYKKDQPPAVWTFKKPMNVTVTFYNNSYSPKAVVNAEKNNMTLSERYVYEGEQIEHFSKKGYVRKNEKGVKYVEYFDADLWINNNESLFSRMDESVVINTANFSLSNLTVTAVYPYYEVESTNYNYSQIDYSPYKTFSPAFYFLIMLVSVIFWVTNKTIGRIL